MSRLKMITGDLADIWLHEGNRALKYVGETKVGQKAKEILDNTIDYQEKYRLVKETSTLVIEKVQEKGSDLVEKVTSTKTQVVETIVEKKN
jgi:hypothetical protein